MAKAPKPIYYVFEMFQQLRGQLLEIKGGSVAVGALAARQDRRLAAVMWNYNWQRPEKGAGQEGAAAEQLSLNFSGLPDKTYQINLRQISENYGNPLPGLIASVLLPFLYTMIWEDVLQTGEC